MLKCSHKFVAERIADRYHLPFAYKTALIFGGIFQTADLHVFKTSYKRKLGRRN